MPERGCHALALDGEKHQVDSLTSNIGHLLWSGLLDADVAAKTCERLLEPQLYSGWGVRTLGSSEAGYNPLGYHTGTVWPHENSLIVAGLARYGPGRRRTRWRPRFCCSALLRASAARGIRRLPRATDLGAGRIPHRLPSTGVGCGSPVAAAHHAPGPGSRAHGSERGRRRRHRGHHAHSGRSLGGLTMDDSSIRVLVSRLARPHPSGGVVVDAPPCSPQGRTSRRSSPGSPHITVRPRRRSIDRHGAVCMARGSRAGEHQRRRHHSGTCCRPANSLKDPVERLPP